MRAMRTMLALAVAVLGVGATSASAVELHGYWRSGLGGNSVGGGQTCFGLAHFGYKFRLGNECETYGELELRQNLYKDRSGVEFNFVSMLAVQSAQQRTYDSLTGSVTNGPADRPNTFNDIALRQIWIGAKLPQLGGATIWAGNRYYRRNDVHIVDFYYWDVSGPGAGIEDVTVGPVKLALAVFQAPFDRLGDGENPENTPPPFHGTQARTQIWRPDFRIYDIPFPIGTFELGVDLFIDATNTDTTTMAEDAQTVSPWFTIQHFAPGLLGGFNKIAFQYATGSAAVMNPFPQLGNSSDSKQWRIVEQLVFNPIPQVSGMFVAAYHDIDERFGGQTGDFNSARLYSIGARPQWHFNDYFRVALEAGWQRVDPKDEGPGIDDGITGSRDLTKLTIAPTFSAGPGFWARPELRLFATYAHWNDAANLRGVQSGSNGFSATCDAATTLRPFGCDNDGYTFGAQMEAWW